MAVRCEFIDVIVPIVSIDRVYPGGFSAFRAEHSTLFGGRLWNDDHLLRDGAMSAVDARAAVEYWERQGLAPMKVEGGHQVWGDLCVVEHVLGGPTLPCDWLDFDQNGPCVSLKGYPPGPVVGREAFRNVD